MELGIDKQQIEKAKALWTKTTSDPVLLRFLVCALILLVGGGLALRPQAQRLARARKSLTRIEGRAAKADEVVFYSKQIEQYGPALFPTSDVVAWQRYVIDKLEQSGARLTSLEPKKTDSKGVFRILELELNAKGTYSQLADFVDRLEHGEHVVRFERLRLERLTTAVSLECILETLVKGSGEEAGAGRAEGAGGAGEGDAGEADSDTDDADGADEDVPLQAADPLAADVPATHPTAAESPSAAPITADASLPEPGISSGGETAERSDGGVPVALALERDDGDAP